MVVEDTSIEHKRFCSKCKQEKPRTIEYFYRYKSYTNNLSYTCRICHNAKKREYRNSPERIEKTRSYWKMEYRRNRKRRNRSSRQYVLENPFRTFASQAMRNHRDSHHAILITCQDLYELAISTKNCAICGITFDWYWRKHGKWTPNNPTLDRMNNEDVLRRDNVQILCMRCNISKGSRTMKEFIDYCSMVSRLHIPGHVPVTSPGASEMGPTRVPYSG